MENRKKILGANIFWLVLIFTNMGAGIIVSYFTANNIATTLASQLSILATVILYLIVTKQNPIKLLRFKKFHFGSFFLVILLYICVMPAMSLINAASMLFATNAVASSMADMTKNGLGLSILLLAVLPALVEECTFRGVIMGSYATGGRPIKAIVFSAIVFGLMHMNFNQMCYAIFMGFVFGIIVEATGSIWSSITVHFCINAFSTFITWSIPKLAEQMQEVAPAEAQALMDSMNASVSQAELLNMILSLLPVALIGLVLAWLLLKPIARLNGNEDKLKLWTKKDYKEDRDAIPKVRIFDVPYAIAAVICLAFCVLNEIAFKIMGA